MTQNIQFSAKQLTQLSGSYDPSTGQLTGMDLVSAIELGINGNMSNRDRDQLLRRLSQMSTPQSLRDRVIQASGNRQGTTPPEAYTRSGTYSEAKSDSDLREGFKGDRVTDVQSQLQKLGYDLGKSGPSGNGVDGFWGPKTQQAYAQYMKDTHGVDVPRAQPKANRNEGDGAGAKNKVVDEYAQKLIDAQHTPGLGWMPTSLGGADTSKINDVFAKASGPQLRELDRRFKQGVTSSSGAVVKFDDGLRGYIKNEIDSGAQQDALLAQISRR